MSGDVIFLVAKIQNLEMRIREQEHEIEKAREAHIRYSKDVYHWLKSFIDGRSTTSDLKLLI